MTLQINNNKGILKISQFKGVTTLLSIGKILPKDIFGHIQIYLPLPYRPNGGKNRNEKLHPPPN